MLTNLYGPGDNYHPENSHIIPALIRRFHEAKVNDAPKVVIWGTGTPKRGFLYVDDMAEACIHIMNLDKKIYDDHTEPMCSHINVGAGEDFTIRELAEMIKEVVFYPGNIEFNSQQADGSPRKLVNSQRLRNLGWKPKTTLKEGLMITYQWYENEASTI